MQKIPYVFPIIGGRKVEHFKNNLEALNIALTPDHIKYIESVLPFDFGFPYVHFVSLRTISVVATTTKDVGCLRENPTGSTVVCINSEDNSIDGLLRKLSDLPKCDRR